MANTVDYVSTGKPAGVGAIWRAPLGTALPATADADLDNAYKCLGYCSEDGMTNATNISTENIKAWGGDTVLNIQTAKPDTFAGTLIEALNPDVLATVYGEDNVSGTLATGIDVYATSDDAEEYVYVCDMIMRDDAVKRIIIPQGKITEVGEIAYSDSAAVGYAITISASPYEFTGGKVATHREFIKSA